MMPESSLSWQAWAILSAVFAALTAITAKVGIENVPADFATLIRTGVILVVLVLIVSLTGQVPASLSGKSLSFLVLSGLATGASWLCYFRALKLGPASRVAPLEKISIVFIALLGVTLLGERLSLRNGVGLALIVLGAFLISAKN